MSLLRQLFRQIIDKDLPEDIEEILFPLLRAEKHPPVQLLEDISLLWFTPGDDYLQSGSMLECLGKGSEINTIQEYIDNFEQAQKRRKWFKSLSDEYASAVDVINVLRKLRDGNLDFHIEDGCSVWSIDDGDIDTTTLVIYNEELKLNERAKEHIEKLLDEGMYPSVLDKKVRNNEGGLIWLPAWEENIIGRLIIQPELDIGYSEDYWNGEQPEFSSGL
tara:strand:+ start:5722 stop:6378 length:657 start_codon:yes stop_codon:yes gene_type:complete